MAVARVMLWTVFGAHAKEISELLESARLRSVVYDAQHRRLDLTFVCLRATNNSPPSPDVTVELHEVHEVVVGYDTFSIERRPSEVVVPDTVRIDALEPWPVPALTDVECWVDSKQANEDLDAAAQRQVLISTPAHGESVHSVVVLMGRGIPRVHVRLGVRCGAIRASSQGDPLALDQWGAEFQTWWRRWSERSRTAGRQQIEAQRPSTTRYVPPDRPAFDVGPHDVPEELLAPVRAWFESGVQRDAIVRARVEPHLDRTREQDVALAQSQLEDEDWPYAREVDGWWIEGRRVRGRARRAARGPVRGPRCGGSVRALGVRVEAP